MKIFFACLVMFTLFSIGCTQFDPSSRISTTRAELSSFRSEINFSGFSAIQNIRTLRSFVEYLSFEENKNICIVNTEELFLQDQFNFCDCLIKWNKYPEVELIIDRRKSGGFVFCLETKKVRLNFPLKDGSLKSAKQYSLAETYLEFAEVKGADEIYPALW